MEVYTCQVAGSIFTCFGEVDEVACDEIPEALVSIGQRFPQNDLQPSEESHRVQTVEGEAAGERQQGAGRVGRSRWRVGHHVSIHGTVESRCRQGEVLSNLELKQTVNSSETDTD